MYHVVHQGPMPPAPRPIEAPARNSFAREQLLARAASLVTARGLSDGSLRTIATELGTSHRMLIYHFGSAEEFWEAVLNELRTHDQSVLEQSRMRGRANTLENSWMQLSSERHLPRMRLFFQIYGEALKNPTRFQTFLEEVVDSWLSTIAVDLERQHGASPADAKRQARLDLAVMRGLLLDLLTTGDRKGTTAALLDYARRMRPREARS
jgi:AcrR family transcriptional regulator